MAADAERQVLAAFAALYDAVTRDRDGVAGATLFADEPDITMWGSEEAEQAVGPAAVRELLDRVAASEASITFRWARRDVHVEGDVAWVNAAGRLAVERAGAPRVEGPYRVTAVFVRRGERWLWHTHSGSEPKA